MFGYNPQVFFFYQKSQKVDALPRIHFETQSPEAKSGKCLINRDFESL